MSDTSTFEDRMITCEEAERKFQGFLLWAGKKVRRVGQEVWCPTWVHALISFVFNDVGIETIKHFPDLSTERALVQVKSAPSESKYSCVTIEKASFNTAKRLMDCGVPVLLVWLYEDGKTFYGQWVNTVTPIEPDTPREELKGSRTPMYKIAKSELKPAREFLDEL